MFVKLLFIFFSLYVSLIYCQTVLPVNPSGVCSPYIGDLAGQPLCNSKLVDSGNIYSNPSDTQEASRATIQSFLTQLGTLPSCAPVFGNAIKAVCERFLGRCVTTPSNITPTPVALESKLCKSVCVNITTTCGITNSAAFNCSDERVYPSVATYYDLTPFGGPASYEVPCTDPTISSGSTSSSEENTPAPIFCPYPLIPKNQSDPQFAPSKGYTYLGALNCVLPCPAPFYDDSQWNKFYTMSKIISTISFCCCIYNVITFGLLNTRPNKYTYCIVAFCSSVFLMNLMDIVTYGIGYKKVLCPEEGRFAVQGDASCGVTGSFFHLAVCNGVLWWTTMSICLLSVIKRIKIIKFRYFIIFNTSFSLLLLIIPLGMGRVESGLGTIGCWVRGTVIHYVFWLPLGIALLIGAGCIVVVIYEIYRISKNVSTDRSFITLQIKPFLCVFFIGGSFLYLIAFNYYHETHKYIIEDSMKEYVMCLLSPGNDRNSFGCKPKGPPFAAYFTFYFFTRLFGVLFFLIYGASSNSKEIWLRSIVFNNQYVRPVLMRLGVTDFHSTTGTNLNSLGSKNKGGGTVTRGGDKTSGRNTFDSQRSGESGVEDGGSSSC